MTVDAVLSSLARSCADARQRGEFVAAEDYEDAMLLLVSRAHEESASFLATLAGASERAPRGLRLC